MKSNVQSAPFYFYFCGIPCTLQMEDLVPALQHLYSSALLSSWPCPSTSAAVHLHGAPPALGKPTHDPSSLPSLPPGGDKEVAPNWIKTKRCKGQEKRGWWQHRLQHEVHCALLHSDLFFLQANGFGEDTLVAESQARSFLCKTSSRGASAFLPQLPSELFGRRVGWWDIGTRYPFLLEAAAVTTSVSSQAWPPTQALLLLCAPPLAVKPNGLPQPPLSRRNPLAGAVTRTFKGLRSMLSSVHQVRNSTETRCLQIYKTQCLLICFRARVLPQLQSHNHSSTFRAVLFAL